MRSRTLASLLLLAFTLADLACASPYAAPAEKLVLPKKKGKGKPVDPSTLVNDPDQCTYNFAKPAINPARRKVDAAVRAAQEADGTLSEAKNEAPAARLNTLLEQVDKLKAALAMDPYSPQATYELAVAYALIGKNKCAVAMVERLADLGKFADVADDAAKFKSKVRKETAFSFIQKDVEGALGQ